jgi:N-acetylmuramoyl-L-alanine amidase
MKQTVKKILRRKYKWGIVLLGIFIFAVLPVFYSDHDLAEALILKQGSVGEEVKRAQEKLKEWGYYNGQTDGIFGAATKKAVIYFQQKNSLIADGIIGGSTFRALGLPQYARDYTPTEAMSSEAALLSKAIWAEAEGEPYIGKVAVGAVLLNRVNSGDFPNSLNGVIYQSLALESVSNGRLNSRSDSESLRAAKDALNGWDPTYGCLYFWNPKTSTSPWIWTRQIVVQYGNHVFGK